jgi:lysophospholipase L1-like esterase
MERAAWVALAWVIGILAPWIIGLVRRRADLAALTACVSMLLISAHVLTNPSADRWESAILIGGLAVLNVGLRLAPPKIERMLVGIARRRAAKASLLGLAATLVPVAVAEFACQILTEVHLLNYHKAIKTVWRPGQDDWRLATITSDEKREPDPVLFWRPVSRPPFSSQRFKGPFAEVPKPPGVVRVMCYGDSLTDGPPKGGWPASLQRLLTEHSAETGRRYEVLNAGVAGYSSHQGVQRFLQEVDEYTPDLLLVSFGWNDVADASGQPDKTFRIPSWPIVACQRALVRYRAYLVLMYYTQRWRARPPAASSGSQEHRVSVEDYVANLERFRVEAQTRRISIAFLTRPHICPAAELSKNPTWRGSVPGYNAALMAWARNNGANVLDVQGTFEHLPASLFADECHFTPQGYEYLGRLVYEHMMKNPNGPLRAERLAAAVTTESGTFTRRGTRRN